MIYTYDMNILYFYNEEWEKDYVQKDLGEHSIDFFKSIEEATPEILNSAEIVSVFVSHPVDKEFLDAMPNIKLIATRSTGFDHIDIEEAKAKGIEVVSVPFYGENTVAEFAFALLLTLSRKTYDAYDRIAETGSFSQEGLRGFDLKGKTIGVIGTGHIGLNIVSMAKGFNMNIIAFDPFPKEEKAQELGFIYVSLDELLAGSDVITIHAPHTDSTHHMINTGNIEKIKKGAYLINTARGAVIETQAIVEALEKNILSGAGLDVLEEEGDMKDEITLLNSKHPKLEELKNVLSNHYLIDHPRVIITPHIAFNTDEAIKRILDTTADNINSFVNGEIKNSVLNKI